MDIILLILTLLSIIIILYAKPIVTIILGESWLSMVIPFKVIFIAYLMQTLLFSFNPLIRSYGYTKSEFKFYLIKIGVMSILLYPFTVMWGLIGAGFAILLAVILVFPYLIYILHLKTDLKLPYIYKSFCVCLLNALITFGVGLYLPFNNGWLFLVGTLICFSFSLLLFVFIALILNIGPGTLIINTIRSFFKIKKNVV